MSERFPKKILTDDELLEITGGNKFSNDENNFNTLKIVDLDPKVTKNTTLVPIYMKYGVATLKNGTKTSPIITILYGANLI